MRTVNHAARVPPPVRDCPAAGILFLCTGAFVFSLQDVVIKWISGAYPVSQVLAVRSVVAFAPILLLLHLEGGLAGLRSRRLGLLLFRGALLFLSYTAYYLAVAAIPLAEAVSLFYSAPLFIAALSVQLLREGVAPRQWAAVLFGFLGVLVICRPGFGLLDPAAFLALLSAAVYAGGAVASRDLGRQRGQPLSGAPDRPRRRRRGPRDGRPRQRAVPAARLGPAERARPRRDRLDRSGRGVGQLVPEQRLPRRPGERGRPVRVLRHHLGRAVGLPVLGRSAQRRGRARYGHDRRRRSLGGAGRRRRGDLARRRPGVGLPPES